MEGGSDSEEEGEAGVRSSSAELHAGQSEDGISQRTGEGPDGTQEGQSLLCESDCRRTNEEDGDSTEGRVQARNGVLVPKDAGPRTHDDPTLGSDLKEFRTLRMRFPTPSASSTPSPEPQSPMPSFSDYLDAYLRCRRHEGSR
ncbi:hypothetical protein B0H14DRAFT_2601293 [Mycena olivaceomarginata]|nr:hypothetical protein B0H14DRAFT_2601293 [Mycena olivaceomarginata]